MASLFILDGDVSIQNCLKEVLGYFGHDVTCCRSQTQAMRVIRRRQFDLLMIDIRLDGLDAAHLTRRILKQYPLARIIGTTSYPAEEESKAMLEAGALDLMKKPYEIGKILAWIQPQRQGPAL